jgi:hypothetical protein
MPVVTALLSKAKALGGPFVALALLGAAGGWATRGVAEDQQDIAERVAQLDRTTVKRYEFERVLERLDRYAERSDSTSALLRRFLCRSQPALCP